MKISQYSIYYTERLSFETSSINQLKQLKQGLYDCKQ